MTILSPFVRIGDLIEQLDALGSAHSVAVDADGTTLIVLDPDALTVVGTIDLTDSGAWARPSTIGAADDTACPSCGVAEGEAHLADCAHRWQERGRAAYRDPLGVGPTLLDDDGNEYYGVPGDAIDLSGPHGEEPEGPYVRFRDTFTGATRPMPNALQAGVYSDIACPQCHNALTVADAEAGFRLCAYCARERLHIEGRLQSLEDGTGSYVDNETASVIELSHVTYDEAAGNDNATIKRIHVNGPNRGKGVASALLRAACQDADEGGYILHLEVAARAGAGGLDNDQLRAWYGRHGFEPTEGRPGWMDRIPQDGA